MRQGLIINYKDVAAMLANEDDTTQSEFFTVFAEELRQTCGTEYHAGCQMSSIYMKMSEKNKETLQWN